MAVARKTTAARKTVRKPAARKTTAAKKTVRKPAARKTTRTTAKRKTSRK